MRDSNPLRSVFTIIVIPPFSQCFQRFPHGSHITANHCNSLQLPEKRGQNVGTDGRGSPDHRQVEALARPPFHRQILLVVAKQEEESGGVSVLRTFQLLNYAPVLQGGD